MNRLYQKLLSRGFKSFWQFHFFQKLQKTETTIFPLYFKSTGCWVDLSSRVKFLHFSTVLYLYTNISYAKFGKFKFSHMSYSTVWSLYWFPDSVKWNFVDIGSLKLVLLSWCLKFDVKVLSWSFKIKFVGKVSSWRLKLK